VQQILRRHPTVVVLVVSFVAIAGALLVKNRALFDDPIHETGDFAANSIIIEDAKHFDLLVGNYSRQGFSHPGPAAFYLQAAGESLLHDATDVVPAPYNGHAVAVLLLNAALAASTVALLYRAARTPIAVLVGLAAILAFGSAYGEVLALTWMPFYYFAPFLLLMASAGALAGGDPIALPFLVLAGGLLVHGHVEFGLFVPVIAVLATVAFVVHAGGVRRALGERAAASWAALAVLVVFLLPLVLNLVLHWPGEFDEYIDYSTSDKSGGHSLADGLEYVFSFWSREGRADLLPAVSLVALTTALATLVDRPQLRRTLLWCLGMAGAATACLWFYAVRGIDDLSEGYIGYFYWAVPLLVLLVAVTAISQLLSGRRPAVGVMVGASIVAILLAGRGRGLVNTLPGMPQLPAVVEDLAALRDRPTQPLVITLEHAAWPDVTGVLVEAERTGVDACIDDPSWEFMVTEDFICTDREAAAGVPLRFRLVGSTETGVLATMEYSIVTLADPAP
jgi:hypothetical protein